MIEFKKVPVVGDRAFTTLEEAQTHEIAEMIDEAPDFGEGAAHWTTDAIAAFIVEKKDRIIDILTTAATSRPKARRINGGKKTRKASPEVLNAALKLSGQ